MILNIGQRIQNRFWSYSRSHQALKTPLDCLKELFPENSDLTTAFVDQCIKELTQAEDLRRSVNKYASIIGKDFDQKLNSRAFAACLFCYVACRLNQPETIIETGCATGWTSSLFLLALHHNKKGKLITIDLPAVDGERSMDWSLPAGLTPGFLIPDYLKSRWTLILGDVRDELPRYILNNPKVDCFYHDSDHTYLHMIWEYATIWPYLNPGSFLISDDIGWNLAFRDFCREMSVKPVIHQSNPNFAAIRKNI